LLRKLASLHRAAPEGLTPQHFLDPAFVWLKHPERVNALIVQNGNAYDEGPKAFWEIR
jgi:hypothetical protein